MSERDELKKLLSPEKKSGADNAERNALRSQAVPFDTERVREAEKYAVQAESERKKATAYRKNLPIVEAIQGDMREIGNKYYSADDINRMEKTFSAYKTDFGLGDYDFEGARQFYGQFADANAFDEYKKSKRYADYSDEELAGLIDEKSAARQTRASDLINSYADGYNRYNAAKIARDTAMQNGGRILENGKEKAVSQADLEEYDRIMAENKEAHDNFVSFGKENAAYTSDIDDVRREISRREKGSAYKAYKETLERYTHKYGENFSDNDKWANAYTAEQIVHAIADIDKQISELQEKVDEYDPDKYVSDVIAGRSYEEYAAEAKAAGVNPSLYDTYLYNQYADENLDGMISAKEQIIALKDAKQTLQDYAKICRYLAADDLDDVIEKAGLRASWQEVSTHASNHYNGNVRFGMADDEAKKVLRYLYAKYGVDSREFKGAVRYYGHIWNEKAAIQLDTTVRDAVDSSVAAAVALNVAAIPLKFVGGIITLPNTVSALFTNKADINSPIFDLTRGVVSVRDETNRKIESPVGQFLYNTGISALDSALAMAAATATGGALGAAEAVPEIVSAYIGSEVYADTFIENIEKGKSPREASALGFLAASIEGITEKYSVEAILNKAKTLKGAKGIIQSLGFSFLAEGSEEVASNILNRVTDTVLNMDKSEFAKKMKAYSEKYGKKEAFRRIVLDNLGEDALSFLAGGISGVAMGGVSIAQREAFIHSQQDDHFSEFRDALQKGVDADIRSVYNGVANTVLRQLNDLRAEMYPNAGSLTVEQTDRLYSELLRQSPDAVNLINIAKTAAPRNENRNVETVFAEAARAGIPFAKAVEANNSRFDFTDEIIYQAANRAWSRAKAAESEATNERSNANELGGNVPGSEETAGRRGESESGPGEEVRQGEETVGRGNEGAARQDSEERLTEARKRDVRRIESRAASLGVKITVLKQGEEYEGKTVSGAGFYEPNSNTIVLNADSESPAAWHELFHAVSYSKSRFITKLFSKANNQAEYNGSNIVEMYTRHAKNELPDSATEKEIRAVAAEEVAADLTQLAEMLSEDFDELSPAEQRWVSAYTQIFQSLLGEDFKEAVLSARLEIESTMGEIEAPKNKAKRTIPYIRILSDAPGGLVWTEDVTTKTDSAFRYKTVDATVVGRDLYFRFRSPNKGVSPKFQFIVIDNYKDHTADEIMEDTKKLSKNGTLGKHFERIVRQIYGENKENPSSDKNIKNSTDISKLASETGYDYAGEIKNSTLREYAYNIESETLNPVKNSTLFHEEIAERNMEKANELHKDDTSYLNLLEKTHKELNKLCQTVIDTYYEKSDDGKYTVKKKNGVAMIPEESSYTNNIFSNSSYGKDAEPTTLCYRQQIYMALARLVSDRLGRPLSNKDAIIVNQAAIALGVDSPCIYCYSLLDRKARENYKLQYIAERDSFFKMFGEDSGNNKETFKKIRAKESSKYYSEYLSKRGLSENELNDKKKARINLWMDLYEYFGEDAYNTVTPNDVRNYDEEAPTRKNFSEIKNEQERKLKIKAFDDLIYYAQSSSQAKKIIPYSSYSNGTKNSILNWSKATISKLNGEFGLRWYCHADFHPAFVIDNMQQILDASVMGLKGLMYCKPTEAAKIFAPTGMLMNVSCFAKYENGEYIEDSELGANWKDVQELRKQYKNVGAVMVVTTDDMLRWAVAQDWIDVVIPLHLVRAGHEFVREFGLQNYSAEQSDKMSDKDLYARFLNDISSNATKSIEKHYKSVYPSEHNNDYETYMSEISRRGLKARFDSFRMDVESGAANYKGTTITTDMYMKLVNETRMPMNEATLLQPDFDFDAAKKSVLSLMAKGYFDYFKKTALINGKEMNAEQVADIVASDIREGKSVKNLGYGVSLKNADNIPYDSKSAKEMGYRPIHRSTDFDILPAGQISDSVEASEGSNANEGSAPAWNGKTIQGEIYHQIGWRTWIHRNDAKAKSKINIQVLWNNLARDWGFGKFVGGIHKKNVLGIFALNSKAVRTRSANDLPSYAHEFSHWLDDRYSLTPTEEVEAELIKNAGREFLSNYPKERWGSEGFAEFGRHLFESRGTAEDFYPKTIAWLKTRLDEETYAKLMRSADSFNEYYTQDFLDKAQSYVVTTAEADEMNKDVTSFLDRFRQEHIDTNFGIRRVGYASGRQNAYNLAANTAYIGEMTAHSLFTEQINHNGEVIGASLRDCLRPIMKGNRIPRKAIDAFGVAAVLNQVGYNTSNDIATFAADLEQDINDPVTAKISLAVLYNENPGLEKALRNVIAYANRNLYMLVDAGVISKATADEWTKRNPNYLPLYKADVTDGTSPQNRNRTSRKYTDQDGNIRRRRGSNGRLTINPLENVVKQTVSFMEAARRNTVAQAIVDDVNHTSDPALFLARKPRPITASLQNMAEIKERFKKLFEEAAPGRSDLLMQFIDQYINDTEIFYSHRSRSNKQTEMVVFVNGNPRFYDIYDPLLMKSIESMIPSSNYGITEIIGRVTRFMSSMATSAKIAFSVTNPFRDVNTAAFQVGMRNIPSLIGRSLSGYALGLRRFASVKDTDYKDFIRMGGGGASFVSSDRNASGRFLDDIAGFGGYGGGISGYAQSVIAAPMDAIEFLSNALEKGTRYAVYKTGIKNGLDREGAFRFAMEVTTDFRKRGSSQIESDLRKLIPFYGAAVNGGVRMIDYFTAEDMIGTKKRKAVIAERVSTFVAMSAAASIIRAVLIALGGEKEKERYRRLSTYQKNNYYLFPTFNGKYIALPKPREWGVLTSLFDSAIDRKVFENEYAFYDFFGYATDMALPSGVAEFVSSVKTAFTDGVEAAFDEVGSALNNIVIVNTFYDLARNKDFAGRPIVPGALEDSPAREQTKETTSRISYAIGQAINASPIKIDYIFSQYLGGLWDVVSSISRMDGKFEDFASLAQRFVKDPLFSTDIVNIAYERTAELELHKDRSKKDEVKYVMANSLTSFYSKYYKVAKTEKETETSRNIRAAVLTMMLDGENAEPDERIVKLLTESEDASAADLLPSILQSSVTISKEDYEEFKHILGDTVIENGGKYSIQLTAEEYYELQTHYNSLVYEGIENALRDDSLDAEEKVDSIIKTKKSAKKKATDAIIKQHYANVYEIFKRGEMSDKYYAGLKRSEQYGIDEDEYAEFYEASNNTVGDPDGNGKTIRNSAARNLWEFVKENSKLPDDKKAMLYLTNDPDMETVWRSTSWKSYQFVEAYTALSEMVADRDRKENVIQNSLKTKRNKYLLNLVASKKITLAQKKEMMDIFYGK